MLPIKNDSNTTSLIEDIKPAPPGYGDSNQYIRRGRIRVIIDNILGDR